MAPTRRSQTQDAPDEAKPESPTLAPGSPQVPGSPAAETADREGLGAPTDGLPEWAAAALAEPVPEDDPAYCRLRYMQHALMTATRVRLQARAEEQASRALSTLAAKHMQDLSDHAACISRSLQHTS